MRGLGGDRTCPPSRVEKEGKRHPSRSGRFKIGLIYKQILPSGFYVFLCGFDGFLWDVDGFYVFLMGFLLSGKQTVRYGKWSFIYDIPIKHCDFQ